MARQARTPEFALHAQTGGRAPHDRRKTSPLSGLGVMGGPMAGHLARAGHELTVYNRTPARAEARRRSWPRKVWRRRSPPLPPKRRRGGCGDHLRRQRRRSGRSHARRRTARSRDGAGRAVRRPHHRLGADRRGSCSRSRRARPAGVDAPVSGGQAGAENGKLSIMCGGTDDGDGGGEPVMQAYAARIVHVGGRRRRADDQDGQPDLHRRRAAGPVRSAALRAGGRARPRQGVRGDLGRRGAELADGQSLEDDGEGRVRFRLRGRLDAQGSRPGAGRGAAHWAHAAGHRAGRPILCRSAGAGRRPAGHQRAGAAGCPKGKA